MAYQPIEARDFTHMGNKAPTAAERAKPEIQEAVDKCPERSQVHTGFGAREIATCRWLGEYTGASAGVSRGICERCKCGGDVDDSNGWLVQTALGKIYARTAGITVDPKGSPVTEAEIDNCVVKAKAVRGTAIAKRLIDSMCRAGTVADGTAAVALLTKHDLLEAAF